MGRRTTKSLKIVHFNVYDPMKTACMIGARYLITFIDDFAKNVWLNVLKFKWDCFEKFKEIKELIEIQSKHKIKMF